MHFIYIFKIQATRKRGRPRGSTNQSSRTTRQSTRQGKKRRRATNNKNYAQDYDDYDEAVELMLAELEPDRGTGSGQGRPVKGSSNSSRKNRSRTKKTQKYDEPKRPHTRELTNRGFEPEFYTPSKKKR